LEWSQNYSAKTLLCFLCTDKRLDGINSYYMVALQKAWQQPIYTYFWIRQLGKSFTLKQWIQKLIDAL
jgi:hypothetical protein